MIVFSILQYSLWSVWYSFSASLIRLLFNFIRLLFIFIRLLFSFIRHLFSFIRLLFSCKIPLISLLRLLLTLIILFFSLLHDTPFQPCDPHFPPHSRTGSIEVNVFVGDGRESISQSLIRIWKRSISFSSGEQRPMKIKCEARDTGVWDWPISDWQVGAVLFV